MSVGALGVALVLLAGGGAPMLAVGGWVSPWGIALRADALSQLMLLGVAGLFTAATLMNLGPALQGVNPTRNPVYHLTFPLLLLALNGLVVTGDYFNFYVFFELVAVSSYLLVSMGHRAPLEAAWKYSAQSVLGSLCLLFAIVWLYGETGALAMAEVASRLDGPALWVAPFLLLAFLMKGAIFPFHFWQPDAHAAATPAGSMLLAGLLISMGMYGLLRFWPGLMGGALQGVFLAVGALSVVFGAVAAWREADLKRLLGYSSVSQLGFVLLGLGWGTLAGAAAALFYLVSHAIAKGLLFAIAGALSERVGDTSLEALRGRGRQQPALGLGFLVGALSLAGIPPAGGFVAKWALLRAGYEAGGALWAGFVLLGSALTLLYGARAFMIVFWSPAEAGAETHSPLRWPEGLAIGGLTLVLLGLSFGAGPLYAHCLTSVVGWGIAP